MPAADGPALVWFRDDLRLADQPALAAAAASGPVGAFYILEQDQGLRPPGGASRWWLAGALRALAANLGRLGVPLLVLAGRPRELVPQLVEESQATSITWTRRYGGAERELDAGIKARLTAASVAAESFNGQLLHESLSVRPDSREFGVYSAFFRAFQALGHPPAPLPAPDRLPAFEWPETLRQQARSIESLDLEPSGPDWAGGLRETWTRGEAGAQAALRRFAGGPLSGYAAMRDRPDVPGTSQLSPHLRFGEMSPRAAYHAALAAEAAGRPTRDVDKFISELGWREFAYHLLFHHPDLAVVNYRRRFDAFPWRKDPAALKSWQKGATGYPLVDAGMRQLWQTGYLHNRVRMVVASFLIKHLMIDWREGEAWFWDTLVDADPANNAASWQWVAGSGADAAPFFRIFNPVLQGQKFDPKGDYVRRYVPELARLPAAHIHKPWGAPAALLADCGIRIGTTYPAPIVDHDQARARALAAFESLPKAENPKDAPA